MVNGDQSQGVGVHQTEQDRGHVVQALPAVPGRVGFAGLDHAPRVLANFGEDGAPAPGEPQDGVVVNLHLHLHSVIVCGAEPGQL